MQHGVPGKVFVQALGSGRGAFTRVYDVYMLTLPLTHQASLSLPPPLSLPTKHQPTRYTVGVSRGRRLPNHLLRRGGGRSTPAARGLQPHSCHGNATHTKHRSVAAYRPPAAAQCPPRYMCRHYFVSGHAVRGQGKWGRGAECPGACSWDFSAQSGGASHKMRLRADPHRQITDEMSEYLVCLPLVRQVIGKY